jgi:hypothetical protein
LEKEGANGNNRYIKFYNNLKHIGESYSHGKSLASSGIDEINKQTIMDLIMTMKMVIV